MRLMTFNSKKDGLIDIEEASDDAPQEVLFTIPVENSYTRHISSLHDFMMLLRELKFSAKIYGNNETEKVVFRQDYRTGAFITRYRNIVIEFFIDPYLNLYMPDTSGLQNRTTSSKTGFMKKLISKIFWLILAYRIPAFELKWKYTGSIHRSEFQDKSFLVLSLQSTEQIDQLYLQYKAYFID